MAISRAQLVKELEPGLNALFGLEYKSYANEHAEIFDTESSDRAFEEEVMLSGFANASVKPEGQGVQFDDAQETFTARYTNETIALAFAITEEAIEDNLYDRLASRYTKALARSMANTKQVKAAAVLNNGFNANFAGGDGVALFATNHPTIAGTFSNELAVASDLNETSLEQALIDIAAMTDERGLKIASRGMKLIIPSALQFTADRLMKSEGRTGTADNDINAVKNMGMIPEGYTVNHFLTSNKKWFIKTDVPNGLKHFVRSPIKTSMEGDFDTGNVRYKARERYVFGFSDPRGIFGSDAV
ncbi:Mu-like prophage major head subunit gpT family protein [bacterium]|nr:Mu-like prophage major head subunit gpT family protein [bacterium]